MRPGLRPAILAVAGFGCVGAAVLSACIVAPPAELPEPSPTRPTILHDSVSPPADHPLTSWTDASPFVVPVQLGDVNESFVWDVYVDYLDNPLAQLPAIFPVLVSPSPGSLDAGIAVVEFTLPPGRWDLTLCHTIEFRVGHGFLVTVTASQSQPDYHAFDSVGGDSFSWYWSPPGCYASIADAGTSVADAPADSLPIPPSSGEGSE
jgi:hypothetical protein